MAQDVKIPPEAPHAMDGAEEHFGLSVSLVREVAHALEEEEHPPVATLAESLHAADLAELINLLSPEHREKLISLISATFDPEVLTHLAPELRDEVMGYLGAEKSAAAIAQLDRDDAVHVIEDLDEEEQREILDAVPQLARGDIEEGLAYPESSAGRMMHKKLVTVPEFWTVGDAIDHLRAQAGKDTLPSDFYVIFVIDPRFRPTGGLLLSRMLQGKREMPLHDLMYTDLHAVHTHTDQEEVAYLFRKYGLVEAPVINEDGRLVGSITVDDIVDVVQEESEEDFLHLGGVSAQDLHASLPETVKRRFPWLFVNLITAFLSSRVIGHFQGEIAQLVLLASLMPIIASIGGNAGTQAVTVAVRALATREVTMTNAFSVIRKELAIGFINGIILAAITGTTVYLAYHDTRLAWVFGAGIAINLLVAGLAGAAVPLVLHRMKLDPAIASSVFLTMMTDACGFFAFLGLAAVFLL